MSKVKFRPSSQPKYFTNMANSIKYLKGEEIRSSSQNPLEYSHPPLPEEPPGVYDTLITDSDMALSKRKFIKVVSSSGEVEMEPDEVEFCVKITTNKVEAQQARESVKKRKDFILAALRKFRIPDNFPIFSIAKRATTQNHKIHKGTGTKGGGTQNQENKLDPEVEKEGFEKKDLIYSEEFCVKCATLMQYLQVFSICNEKLDRHVEVSKPVVRFSPKCVQNYTQKAVRLAMANAIQKANELISSTRQRVTLGRLYYSVEESLQIEPVHDYDNNDNFETFTWKRLNKIVVCNLSSVFELEHAKVRKLI